MPIPNAGTFHQSDLPVHFGLGSAAAVDRLVIVWPNGVAQTYLDIPADHYVTCSIYPKQDYDRDLDVDNNDLTHMLTCRTGAGVMIIDSNCTNTDFDGDNDSDLDDFGVFQRRISGPDHPQTDTLCLVPPIIQ